jgi:hypothetical protein
MCCYCYGNYKGLGNRFVIVKGAIRDLRTVLLLLWDLRLENYVVIVMGTIKDLENVLLLLWEL